MKKIAIGMVMLASWRMWLRTLTGVNNFTWLREQPWTHNILVICALLAALLFHADYFIGGVSLKNENKYML